MRRGWDRANEEMCWYLVGKRDMARYELCKKFGRPGFGEKVSCQQQISRRMSDPVP